MNEYLKCAIEEIENKTYGVTKQYLDVNTILKVNGNYVVERIDDTEDTVTYYFRIENEKYFFGVSINKFNHRIDGIPFIMNSNNCYLCVSSDNLSKSELEKYTKLKSTGGWTKGELRNNKTVYKSTIVKYELVDSTCYTTEDALNKLLDILETDVEGLRSLGKVGDMQIEICKYQYVSANAGLFLDKQLIARLNRFGLPVDIDTYIDGERIKD